jgi:hypothetical protein
MKHTPWLPQGAPAQKNVNMVDFQLGKLLAPNNTYAHSAAGSGESLNSPPKPPETGC